jgi:hypothetical protein
MTKQQKLMAFIESHAVRAVALCDEQILVEEMYATGPDGFPDTAKEMYGPYCTVIPVSGNAARDWLGY